MYFFVLPRDQTLDTHKIHRRYLSEGNPQSLQLDRLYLAVGDEVSLLTDKLNELHKTLPPAVDEAAQPVSLPPGLRLIAERTLLVWLPLPARLGRVSTRIVGEGLHLHSEAQPLPAQLLALRGHKPEKQHFRLAIVNGFGSNLGDCTIGITAFRLVLQHLRQHFPAISCDVLFGPEVSVATVGILRHAPEVERVLFHALTAADFAQYDGYFDFTDLLQLPRFGELPNVDWMLSCIKGHPL